MKEETGRVIHLEAVDRGMDGRMTNQHPDSEGRCYYYTVLMSSGYRQTYKKNVRTYVLHHILRVYIHLFPTICPKCPIAAGP